MLRKLIKYDIKSISRVFIPMWILTPIVALMLSFSIRGMSTWTQNIISSGFMVAGNGILMMVMMLLFFGIMVGLFVMTILFTIQRFWNGLLKEEGYLMFTLPVKVWELIVSKAITAIIVSCISILVGIFSSMILAVFSTDEFITSLAYVWKYMFGVVWKIDARFIINFILCIILFIVMLVENVYHVYTAMAVGQLWQEHKILGSCLSYVGISMIVSILGNVMETIFVEISPWDWDFYINEYMDVIYLLILLFISVMQVLIYHVITERILSTKLNLE